MAQAWFAIEQCPPQSLSMTHLGYTTVERYSYGLVLAVPSVVEPPAVSLRSNEAHSGASTGAVKKESRLTDIVSPLTGPAIGPSSPVSEPSSSLSTVWRSTAVNPVNVWFAVVPGSNL